MTTPPKPFTLAELADHLTRLRDDYVRNPDYPNTASPPLSNEERNQLIALLSCLDEMEKALQEKITYFKLWNGAGAAMVDIHEVVRVLTEVWKLSALKGKTE